MLPSFRFASFHEGIVDTDPAALSIDQLIMDGATGRRALSNDDLRRITDHIARAGFDPLAAEQVRGALSGVLSRGRVLRGRDRLPPAERHFLGHVVQRREWPLGITLSQYLESIRAVIDDPTSGIVANRYLGEWSVAILRETRDLRGSGGNDWTLVQYRLGSGHWVTAFQPEAGLEELQKPAWSNVRWLRQPIRSNS